jgi:ribonuclease R
MVNFDEREILDIFESTDKPLNLNDISKHLNQKIPVKKIDKILKDLVNKGLLKKNKSKKFNFPGKSDLVVGQIKRHPNGHGVLKTVSSRYEDIFLTKSSMGKAIHGDKVLVKIDKYGKNKKVTGSVVKIIERKQKPIVGIFYKFKGSQYVIPENPRFSDEIVIPNGETKDARNGQVVVVNIIEFKNNKHRIFYGKIEKILGYPNDSDVELLSVIYNFELPFEFSMEVIEQAKKLRKSIEKKDLIGRVDLRNKLIITVDGEDAKDFDDAISLEIADNGDFILGVHIADVAYFVKKETAIDKDAYLRGTSVYFPNMVIPMLPLELSNELCSLKPDQDRLTVTVEMKYSKDGTLISYSIFNSVIFNSYRMTYDQVFRLITSKDSGLDRRYSQILPMLKKMKRLAVLLKEKRKERYSLDFDFPEPEVLLDKNGQVTGIVKRDLNIAHGIIEEFMLQANETVAKHLASKHLQILYRIHDEPDADALKELVRFFKSLNLSFGNPTNKAKWLQDILKRIEKHKLKHVISMMILRAMKKALYSHENRGHFGLALEFYTHFTSPIRRYPDLLVHRVLKEDLSRSPAMDLKPVDDLEDPPPDSNSTDKQKSEKRSSTLASIGEQTTRCEIRSDEAERDVMALKKAQFMEKKIGDEYDGLIIGVHPFGFFVELFEHFVEGMVSVSSMEDDYYLFDDINKTLTGKKTSKKFKLGDIVKVMVSHVDVKRRLVSFVLPDHLVMRYKKSKKKIDRKNSKKHKRADY